MATTLLSSPLLKSENSSNMVRSNEPEQNLFIRIDDISNLNSGDKVIIANHFGGVLDHFGGNPTYLCARDYDGRSPMGDKYFITNSLSNYQVLNVGKVGDYFTFQFTYTYSSYWNRVICKDKYLCYKQDGGYWDDSKDKANLLGDLYFTDNVNSEYAQWKFSPNSRGDGFFNMKRSGEEYDTHITYVSGTTRDRFGYEGHESSYSYGVRLYKLVNLKDYQCVFNTYNIKDPNRTTFYQGEDADLTGLEFNLYLFDKNYVIDDTTDFASDSLYTIHSQYEHEKNLYSSISVEGSGNNTRAVFTYLGLSYRVFISIIQEEAEVSKYQLMDYSTLDYRGTYYLGTVTSEHPYGEDGEDATKYTVYALNGVSGTKMGNVFYDLSMDITSKIIDVPSTGASQAITVSKFQVKRVIVNNVSNTYLYNPVSGQYVSYDESNENALCYVSESELTNKEVFSVIDSKPVLNSNMYIVLDGLGFVASNNASNATSMFKLMPKSDFYTELNGFKTTFFENIECNPQGGHEFTNEDWLVTKEAFDALSVDAQGYLANLTYAHNLEEEGSIGQMIDKYDYILSKYEDSYVDYMNRKEAAYVNYYSNNNSIFAARFIEQNSNIIILIIVISAVIVAPIAFIIKKKRQSYD